ncbi:hypothetical protein TGVAND_238077 [Toxoplasma gondii VAND]|uniref:Uncharacterized protein n=1 Tax=Toxoplasma gondii VAND TaxID=933077 RepID=A0A086PGW7_TOXGO|nr:hypothetical protein TGVAND_238077 [Toxoplasma gondii VAND]
MKRGRKRTRRTRRRRARTRTSTKGKRSSFSNGGRQGEEAPVFPRGSKLGCTYPLGTRFAQAHLHTREFLLRYSLHFRASAKESGQEAVLGTKTSRRTGRRSSGRGRQKREFAERRTDRCRLRQ